MFVNTDLSDFLLPSQACVNPLFIKQTDTPAAATTTATTTKTTGMNLSLDLSDSTVDFGIKRKTDDSSTMQQELLISKPAEKKVAAVSLTDCLACSGCVTSAETVIVAQQSYHQLLSTLQHQQDSTDKKVVVVCISPQSLASIADLLNMGLQQTFLQIAAVLKSIGVKYVVDSACAGDVALMETAKEFLFRFRNNRREVWNDRADSVVTTSALSATSITIHPRNNNNNSGALLEQQQEECGYSLQSSPTLPMFVSQCPGWICYAEKTVPQIIPFLSTTKSPQQILGVLLKQVLAEQIVASTTSTATTTTATAAQLVYVVSVQPCFDKKLEASRLDFLHRDEATATTTQEVDLVLSTTELWNLFEHLLRQQQPQQPQQQDDVTATPADVSEVAAFVCSLPPDSLEENSNNNNNNNNNNKGGVEIEHLLRACSADGRLLVSSLEQPSAKAAATNTAAAAANNAASSVVVDVSTMNGGSGGYLDHVLRVAAESLLGFSGLRQQPLVYTVGRNSDIAELSLFDVILAHNNSNNNNSNNNSNSNNSNMLESSSLSQTIRVGRVYGFRNIQSVLLKLRRNKLELDLIEVMACPSGCVNGGGQIKLQAKESSAQMKARVAAVTAVFHSRALRSFEESPLVQFLEQQQQQQGEGRGEEGRGEEGGEESLLLFSERRRRELFHTRYHAIPKLEQVAPLAVKW